MLHNSISLHNNLHFQNNLDFQNISEDEGESSLNSDEEIPDKIFTIKNLDTGEEIDLRDENKETFHEKFVRVVSIKPELYLEEFL